MIAMMEMLVLVLFVSSLGSLQQAASQDVEIRGPSVVEADLDGSSSVSSGGGGGGGGGQSRTVYGQRHLSPHRMMHFGKKAEERQAPIIYTSWPPVAAAANFYEPTAQVVADPAALASALMGPFRARQSMQQRSRARNLFAPQMIGAANYLPFEFSLQLEKGQILQAVPEDTIAQAQASSYQLPVANRKLVYDYAESFPDSSQQPQQLLTFGAINEDAPAANAHKRYRQFSGQRSSKLQENTDDSSGNKPNGNAADEVIGDAERAQQQDNNNSISGSNNNNNNNDNQHEVSTRSMHRSNTLTLPRKYLSEILYGSQGSPSMPNFGAYNKKAEPKENHFFMHFGRK